MAFNQQKKTRNNKTYRGIVDVVNHVFVSIYVSNVMPNVNKHLKQFRGEQPDEGKIERVSIKDSLAVQDFFIADNLDT